MIDKIEVDNLLKKQQKRQELQHMQHLVGILNELRSQYGEGVIDSVYKVQRDFNIWQWNNIANSVGSNSTEDLIKVLWEPMKEDGLEYTEEKTDNGVQMHCTKCPIYDTLKEVGLTEWGYHLICNNDEYIVEGFNSEIGFKRTKTLMEGHDCCNHFYYIKDKHE